MKLIFISKYFFWGLHLINSNFSIASAFVVLQALLGVFIHYAWVLSKLQTPFICGKKWWEGLDCIISTFISTVFFCSSFVRGKNMNTYSLKVPVSGSSVITSCNASTQMLTMPQNLSWITLITENKASLLMLISPSLLTSSVHFHWKKKMGQCYFAFTLLVTQQSLIMLSTQFSRGNNFFTLYAFHMGKIHSNSILQ